MSYEEFLSEWHNDSPFVTVKTSGSTGEPKVMQVEKERMLASARMTCDFLGLKEGDTALLCMSLDYIAGKMMVVRAIERKLKLTVVEPSNHPLANLTTLFDFIAMVPSQVYETLQVPAEAELLVRSRNIIIGGGAISPELQKAIADNSPFGGWGAFSSYGMTETLSHIALRKLNGPDAFEWYTPLPGVEVSLGEDDCLVINAPHVCKESLITNDIAELLPLGGQGGFRIKGRKDNVICSGGIKIQTEEVEALLRPHLMVPFMITYKSDPKFGQAIVLLTEGGNEEDLKPICQSILPKYWQPKHYVTVEQLPLTETGKPARKKAQELIK